MACPAVPWRWLERAGDGAPQIDGCLRQNPAYRQAHKNMAPPRQYRGGVRLSVLSACRESAVPLPADGHHFF